MIQKSQIFCRGLSCDYSSAAPQIRQHTVAIEHFHSCIQQHYGPTTIHLYRYRFYCHAPAFLCPSLHKKKRLYYNLCMILAYHDCYRGIVVWCRKASYNYHRAKSLLYWLWTWSHHQWSPRMLHCAWSYHARVWFPPHPLSKTNNILIGYTCKTWMNPLITVFWSNSSSFFFLSVIWYHQNPKSFLCVQMLCLSTLMYLVQCRFCSERPNSWGRHWLLISCALYMGQYYVMTMQGDPSLELEMVFIPSSSECMISPEYDTWTSSASTVSRTITYPFNLRCLFFYPFLSDWKCMILKIY